MIRGKHAYSSVPFPGHLPESHIGGLRSAGGKHNLRGERAQQGGNVRTGFLHRLAHAPGAAVTGGRVEKTVPLKRLHGRVNLRVQRSGGVVVPVNHAFITPPIAGRSQAGTYRAAAQDHSSLLPVIPHNAAHAFSRLRQAPPGKRLTPSDTLTNHSSGKWGTPWRKRRFTKATASFRLRSHLPRRSARCGLPSGGARRKCMTP